MTTVRSAAAKAGAGVRIPLTLRLTSTLLFRRSADHAAARIRAYDSPATGNAALEAAAVLPAKSVTTIQIL